MLPPTVAAALCTVVKKSAWACVASCIDTVVHPQPTQLAGMLYFLRHADSVLVCLAACLVQVALYRVNVKVRPRQLACLTSNKRPGDTWSLSQTLLLHRDGRSLCTSIYSLAQGAG